jgi:hypothetical protein
MTENSPKIANYWTLVKEKINYNMNTSGINRRAMFTEQKRDTDDSSYCREKQKTKNLTSPHAIENTGPRKFDVHSPP